MKPVRRVLNAFRSKLFYAFQPIFGRDFLFLLLQLEIELKTLAVDTYNRLFKAKRFCSEDKILLHLGCGGNYKEGFINIDFGGHVDLRLDLRKKLPFPDRSIDYIYSEHFLEHLSYSDALDCVKDYRRVLKSGAKLKLVLPQVEGAFRAYLKKDLSFFTHVFEAAGVDIAISDTEQLTPIDWLNHAVFNHRDYLWSAPGGEHQYLYDEQKVLQMLRDCGFAQVSITDFHPDEDSESRRSASFYVVAEN